MVGTTIANLLGCAAIGAFSEYVAAEVFVSERLRLALQVGFLGGLTTFSTFAAESAGLAFGGRIPMASVYILANLLLGWIVLIAASLLVKGAMG